MKIYCFIYKRSTRELMMNVFFLDQDPAKCAKYHFDKHVVKMILEYTQILCTAVVLLDGSILADERKKELWGPLYINHPAVIWGRQSIENYQWLYLLLCYLLDEYTYRYEKKHYCEKFRILLKESPINIEKKAFIRPCLLMPEEYKEECPVASYRNYYQRGKRELAKWKKRGPPDWYVFE